MGLSNSFNSLGRVVGPIWAGFAFDLDYNLPYLSGAVIMAAGFLVSLAFVSQEQGAGSADVIAEGRGKPARPPRAARRSR